MNNRKYFFFFFLLGLVSIIGQGVILREIITLFYGNELFYGLGLGLWLFFTGIGSLLAVKITNRQKMVWPVLAGLILLLPLVVILLRLLVSGFVPPGQLPGLGFSFLFLVIILVLFCLPLGAIFPLAIYQWSEKKKSVNKAYLRETVGFAFGGLLFSFLLATTPFPLTQKLNQLTLSRRYPDLTAAVNSKYNQIIKTSKNGQENIYLNGQLTVTSRETFENKQFLSLITPYIRNPGSVLILGSPNLTAELKRTYPQIKIDYPEADEKLIYQEKNLFATGVNIIPTDVKNYLNQSKQQYDLIIFIPGNPQTLLTNRYFTREMFALVKSSLHPDGVFALAFYMPTDYQSQETLNTAASIYKTYGSVFDFTEMLTPEDQMLLLGSNTGLQINPSVSPYFEYQINQSQRPGIREKIGKQKVKINSDSDPVAFFYQQLFWQTMFNFNLPGITLAVYYIVPMLFIILFWLVMRKVNNNLSLGFLAASSGFILMALESLIIFLFQTKIGYLYSQICLIFAATLSGMAVGVKTAEQSKKFPGWLKAAFTAYIVISVGLGIFTFDQPVFWFLISFVLGTASGLIFALVNNIYSERESNPGFIYAFDLLGGSAGAILTGGLILPMYGVRGLIAGLGILALLNLKIISRLRK